MFSSIRVGHSFASCPLQGWPDSLHTPCCRHFLVEQFRACCKQIQYLNGATTVLEINQGHILLLAACAAIVCWRSCACAWVLTLYDELTAMIWPSSSCKMTNNRPTQCLTMLSFDITGRAAESRLQCKMKHEGSG